MLNSFKQIALGSLLALVLGPRPEQARAEQPAIFAFSPATGLVWTNPIAGNLSVIERATEVSGPWTPFFYDWGTNGLLSTRLPANPSGQAFYRVGVQTNIPDPSLMMHLAFENDLAGGAVLDLSGHENHGRRYGRPLYPTNWPSLTTGPDGSRAGEFHYYFDGYGINGRSGDYIGIPASSRFQNLTQATISVWAHYYRSPNGDINNDHRSTLLNSGKDVPGTWYFGRYYSHSTSFRVVLSPTDTVEPIQFPDPSPDGDSGGWHHYLVTFDHGTTVGYFGGVPFTTNTVGVQALTMAGQYVGIGVWTLNSTPELDDPVDSHPAGGWMNGRVDDVRLYNRTLDATEVQDLYRSFDKLAPSAPADLTATAVSGSQILLRWAPATDLFGIAGYVVRRNGSVVATNAGTTWFDGGLSAKSTNTYTVQAFDPGHHLSPESAAASAVTLEGGVVDLILDNADDRPWVTAEGVWDSGTGWPDYYGTNYLGDQKRIKGSSLTFRPTLPEAGQYSVYIRYPGLAGQTWQMSTAVPIDVVTPGQTNTIALNQRLNYGTWVLLGQFPLEAGTNAYVRVRTEGTDGSFVLGDAVRFVK